MDQKKRASGRYVGKAEQPLTENKFGKLSRLFLRTGLREGKTILEDVSFTAPYKIMNPFPKKDGGISVMSLCASAGIMEGDRQEFDFFVTEGTNLEFLSQSFDKVHKMKEGEAVRHVKAQVEKNAVFYYYPQPVIPYAQSAFESTMEFDLADKSSGLFLLEIISCGRKASDERFRYRKFASRVNIRRDGQLIYRDNTRYEPHKTDMEGLGMYEGYTHMANIFLSGPAINMQEQIWEVLENEKECAGGVTQLVQGDLAVRILGHRAQKLQETAEEIKAIFEEANSGNE